MSDTRAPRDRRVVAIVGLLVLIVIAAGVVSALVPGLDATFAAVPLVIVVLIVGTVVVLGRSITRRSG